MFAKLLVNIPVFIVLCLSAVVGIVLWIMCITPNAELGYVIDKNFIDTLAEQAYHYDLSLCLILNIMFLVVGAVICFLGLRTKYGKPKGISEQMAILCMLIVFGTFAFFWKGGWFDDLLMLKNESPKVLEDVIVEKKISKKTSSYTSDTYLLIFKCGLVKSVSKSEYKIRKEGMPYYLVYVRNSLLGAYPADKYQLEINP